MTNSRMEKRSTGRLRWLRRRLFPTARQLLVKRSLRNLELSAANRILIVGSGDDPYRDLFDSFETYTCFDIVATQDITDVVGDAHQMPFVDESFDCVLASEVMEHLHHPEDFINEVHRILMPGGTIVLTVPFMFHRHADPHDFWRPTPDALRRLLAAFSRISIKAQGNRIHTISDLLTTSFWPWSPFFLLRVLNPVLTRLPGSLLEKGRSTAPSGHLLMATK